MSPILKLDLGNSIFTIRGCQVMIDRDLADLYRVEVKRINEQVKRNIERFPEYFRFQLSEIETTELVANCDRFRTLKHSHQNPFAYTDQGVAMLSVVLRSEIAIQVSIQIINAFVEMRKILLNHSSLIQRLDGLERKQIETEQKFERVFQALEQNTIPTQGIFFDGQVFDAYAFASRIICSAEKNIRLYTKPRSYEKRNHHLSTQ